MANLARLDMLAIEENADFVEALLAERVPFGWEEQSLATGETLFRIHCANADFVRQLAAEIQNFVPDLELRFDSIPDQDWTLAWREFFTPVAAGNFMVIAPWMCRPELLPVGQIIDSIEFHAAEPIALPEGCIPIIIEPRSAFGTGHHATTALCLRALASLAEAGKIRAGMTFLDLGTGSGILGIAACRLGLSGMGLDIDPLSVENARENIAINQVSGFAIEAGSIERVAGQRFDLIFANILAQPLQELAPAMCAAKAGVLILSGILGIQADAVEQAYRAQGLGPAQRDTDGEWVSLVWN